MIFDPTDATSFVVAVQHPETADLTAHPGGFGDSLWSFSISGIPPVCLPGSPQNCASRPNQIVNEIKRLGNEARKLDRDQRQKCSRVMRQQMNME